MMDPASDGEKEAGAMRTFVISDAHGCPEIILNSLEHGSFDPGQDSFVYAGDLLDRGEDAQGCIALVERYASEVVLGNHDVAALLGFYVFPQNPESPGFRDFFRDRVLIADRAKAWKAATSVEGVLITHAGVSEDYDRVFREECGSDPARLAGRLNGAFRAVVEREPRVGDWREHELLGDCGPFWFRPWPYSHLLPLSDCPQVVGHTPPLDNVDIDGFHMIDPSSFNGSEDPGRYRYAIIEEGTVKVEEGTLETACAILGSGESASALCA